MNRTKTLAPLLAATLLATGCASILHTPYDDLRIVTDPPGATARAGDASVVTPGVLKLLRGKDPVVVRVEKEGFEPREVTVTWSTSGLVGMNALGVGVGLTGTIAAGMCSSVWAGSGCSFKSNLAPLLVGAAITAAGLALDLTSTKKYSLERDDLVVRLEPVRPAEAPKGELR